MLIYNDDVFDYVSVLRQWAEKMPDQLAYSYIDAKGCQAETLTYREFESRVTLLAAKLQSLNIRQGERAIILLHDDLHYIIAFFACLYSGIIGVPLHPPATSQQLRRLSHVLVDTQASVILSTDKVRKLAKERIEKITQFQSLIWIDVDKVESEFANEWVEYIPKKDSIAFLQYTSGSTRDPKGVMVTHQNLIEQAKILKKSFCYRDDDVQVTWLPLSHDLGLIFGVLQPCYMGIPCYLMSSRSFICDPSLWLKTLSRYSGSVSGAPNFAYDLCVELYDPSRDGIIDLSRWELALNGAEPIRSNTLKKFTEKFSPYGFKMESFCPAYGMAEATLTISMHPRYSVPSVLNVAQDALKKNQAVPSIEKENYCAIVSSGLPHAELNLIIANPNSHAKCPPYEIGEIFVKSASLLARGYWENEEATVQNFKVQIPHETGDFLSTGDLGFLDSSGYLYITGRIKDTIIIKGDNYIAHDLEYSVDQSHEAIRENFSCAFSVDVEDDERIVIITVIDERYQKTYSFDEIAKTINNHITKEHGINVFEVIFLKRIDFPKTTSGKVQRQACKEWYLSNQLKPEWHWCHPKFSVAENMST